VTRRTLNEGDIRFARLPLKPYRMSQGLAMRVAVDSVGMCPTVLRAYQVSVRNALRGVTPVAPTDTAAPPGQSESPGPATH
jgi:hypothetical protein